MPSDVIVSGGGPAGALCAALLARSGARVRVFERAHFPRSKLCGDTLNPGAIRLLARHQRVDHIVAKSLPLDGMVLTGPNVAVKARYGDGVFGRAIVRRELDALLIGDALAAGASFDDGVTVLGPVLDTRGHVGGVRIRCRDGRILTERARVIVAADGRESRLARALGLTHHAERPRRWAVGAYFTNVDVDRRFGEMHVRRGHYLGVAPVPGALVNVCLVVPYQRGHSGWRDPAVLLRRIVQDDAALAGRFARAEIVERPQVIGPMAVDARAAGVPGLLLAGDAAGFIDPITGDGLRLALASAALTADVVGGVLTGTVTRYDAASLLARKRHAAFARKWRFNRAVRSLVARPAAVGGAAVAARVLPAAFAAVIRYAGDA